MRRIKRAALYLVMVLAVPSWADTPGWAEAPATFAEGKAVCIALHSRASEAWLIYNLPQCVLPLSPCSTFKIPNALIGLDNGVLTGSDHTMSWDGTLHERKVLNQDHDLASAIRNSVVWYFQEVAVQVGAEKMQTELDAFDYGNKDISGGQDHFWLGSSLQISALEQIEFLRALVKQELPANPLNQATV